MRHRFLSNLPLYIQCSGCGYVDKTPETHPSSCQGCNNVLNQGYMWFPDSAYEYAILIEDYHSRPISDLRQQYFEAVAEENLMDYFCSTSEPIPSPTTDWKPITILLFRSLFEVLLEHFLWKIIWTSCLPSPDAERIAEHILNTSWTVSSRINKVYSDITGHKWRDDILQLNHKNLNELLKQTADIRNDFVHSNPFAGHADPHLSDRCRASIPELFELFSELSNLHIYPKTLQLRDLKIE